MKSERMYQTWGISPAVARITRGQMIDGALLALSGSAATDAAGVGVDGVDRGGRVHG
jgi:hypothetical protein